MPTRRLYVDTTNYDTRGAAVADDGQDLDIIFEGGRYDEMGTRPFVVKKPSGGRLVVRALNAGEVTIVNDQVDTAAAKNSSPTAFVVNALHIEMEGFHFESADFHIFNPAVVRMNGVKLGAEDELGAHTCEPDFISIANCTWRGSPNSRVDIIPSTTPTHYTIVWIRDIVTAHMGSRLFRVDPGVPCYAIIMADNIDHNAILGPDRVLNTDFSTHWDRSPWIEVQYLAGCSSLTAYRERITVESRGNMHRRVNCVQIGQTQSKDVTVEHIDAVYKYRWTAGKKNDPQQVANLGDLTTWLFHPVDLGKRFSAGAGPVYTFTNCEFNVFVDEAADRSDLDEPVDIDNVQLYNVWMRGDASLLFYDCKFTWDVPQEFIDKQGPTTDIRFALGVSTGTVSGRSTRHNTALETGSVESALAGSMVSFLNDTESLGFRDSNWGRRVPLTRVLPAGVDGTLIGDVGFENQDATVHTLHNSPPAAYYTEAQVQAEFGFGLPQGNIGLYMVGRNGIPPGGKDSGVVSLSSAPGGTTLHEVSFLGRPHQNTIDDGPLVAVPVLDHRLDGGAWVRTAAYPVNTFTGNWQGTGYTRFVTTFTPAAAYTTLEIRLITDRLGLDPLTVRTDLYIIDVLQLRVAPC